MPQSEVAIEVSKVRKSYGDFKVLKGVTFNVKRGEVLALLGPNGAGKTTTIKMMSTLLDVDKGSIKILGKDVMKDAAEVRALIGLTGQYAAVDEYLTGRENLEMMGRLYRLRRKEALKRADKLLTQFDLVEASKRTVKTYSGGMRRRLDLAMSLIASPPVIFLDEPTTGLDPRSRLTMWEIIHQLAKSGTTILLTTQYMEEADQLADNIVVIDKGVVIAEGTASTLKNKVGSERLELTISKKTNFDEAKKAIKGERKVQTDEENRVISIAAKNGASKLREILQQLDKAKVEVESVSLHRPTLDDVFLSLTGHGTDEDKEKGGQ